MAQNNEHNRRIANVTVSGSSFYNTRTASTTVRNPKITAVEWIDKDGNRATVVKYGMPIPLRVTTENAGQCSVLISVHCEDWEQDHVIEAPVNATRPPRLPEEFEETTISFVPNAEWLIRPSVTSRDITAVAYLVLHKSSFGRSDYALLRIAAAFQDENVQYTYSLPFEGNHVRFSKMESKKITLDGRVNPNTLSISQKGIDFIKSWEKLKLEAYDDSEGYATIGYGHLIWRNSINVKPLPTEFVNGITEAEAEEILRSDLSDAENKLKLAVNVNLYQHEYDALVSLIYNLGSTSKAPNLFRLLNSEEYDRAADEFADITNGGTRGLVIRRRDEINIFKNNIYNNHN